MRNWRAFTLIEIVISIFILMLLLMLAVPSFMGVAADRRLRQSYDAFNNLVNQAHEHSLAEHRAYLIVLGNNSAVARPEFVTRQDNPAPVAEFPLQKTDALKLFFPAALTRTTPPEWIFWPSGTCEPAIIKFAGRNGVWSASYSPLTAHADLTSYVPR